MDPHNDAIMKAYYRGRATVYDRVYRYPERQADLRILEDYMAEQFVGHNVLEIAAGTGYWTRFIASRADSILATDATIEALEKIATHPLSQAVPIKVADAYSIAEIGGVYNGAFAGLWISHVPRQRLNAFLNSMHQLLDAGASVVFIDNALIQCGRLPITCTDEFGNTYQDRKLDDGSMYRVLKNFPTEKELLEVTGGFGTDHRFMELEHFWLFQYTAG